MMHRSVKSDRVRQASSAATNARVDAEIRSRVRQLATEDPAVLDGRIQELDREWDTERYLETLAPTLSLTGIALAARGDRRWLLGPAVVLSFLLQHAVQGWCPPIPILRRLGVRTRKEIERERYALKAIRGDFDNVRGRGAAGAAERALRAVWE